MPSHWDPVVRRSVLLCGLVVMFGMSGYTWIEGWSPWESLFFTLVTLTTVGYGDYGLSDAGERFTAVLMIGGIGTVSYSVSQFFQCATARALHPERRMIHHASKMSDHHIICGLGRTGQRVVRQMMHAGHRVVAIDSDAKQIEQCREWGVVALAGDATDDAMLRQAGIERAKTIAAVTSSDAANAMICLSASAIAPDVNIIARAEDESSVQKLTRAGALIVVNPSEYGGDGIAESLVHPEVARLLFAGNAVEEAIRFAEVEITGEYPHVGRTISQIGAANPRVVFVASRSNEGDICMRPRADTVLEEGQFLIIAGSPRDIAMLQSFKLAA